MLDLNKNKIEIEASVDDQATSKLNRLDKKTEEFTKKAQKNFVDLAAKVYLVQQAYKIFEAVVRVAVQAATEQEDAVNRLNTALKIQGEYTEEVSSQYQKLASTLQKTTRYGDEIILSVIQKLISLGDVAPAMMEKATKATLDFATATKTDLETAALTISKAMAGTVGALQRYGVAIEKDTDASRQAEKVLTALEKKFGGMAQKDVETFSGSIDKLQNSWSDFLETLGGFITTSPVVQSAIEKITHVIDFLNEKLIPVVENQKKLADTSLLERLISQVEKINAEIDKVLDIGRYLPLTINEEKMNALYEQRTKLLLTIAELRANAQAEETLDLGNIDVTGVQQLGEMADAHVQTYYKLLEIVKEVGAGAQRTALVINDSMSSALSNVMRGAMSAREAFKAFGQEALKAVTDFIAQQIVAHTIGKVMSAITTGTMAAMGTAIAAAFQPAATFVSLATFGANAVPAIAGMSATNAAAMAMMAPRPMAYGGEGVVSAPTLFLAGENGPERYNFSPIDRGVGASVSVNIANITIGSKENISELAEQLGFEIERQLRYARGI